MYVDQPRLARPPHDSVIQRPAKKFRENRNKIKAHRPSFYSLNLTHHHAKQPPTKLGQPAPGLNRSPIFGYQPSSFNLHMAISLRRTPHRRPIPASEPLACLGAPHRSNTNSVPPASLPRSRKDVPSIRIA